jgi:hypothetical protein
VTVGRPTSLYQSAVCEILGVWGRDRRRYCRGF